MNGETFCPQGHGPWPAIFMVSGIHGINDGVRGLMRRLAGEGYLGFAHRWYREDPEDVSLAGIAADLREFADRSDVRRVALCGFCRGGTFAMITAAGHPWLAASVIFYGNGGGAPGSAERIAHPVFVVHGEADHVYPVEGTDEWVAALSAHGKTHRYVRVAGGPHAFFDGGSQYDRDLAESVWPELLSFLREHLAEQP